MLAAAVALHTFHFSEAEHTCSTPSHSCTLAEQQFVICKASHRHSSGAKGRGQALPDLPILCLVLRQSSAFAQPCLWCADHNAGA
jgi:hypothetical protein